MRNLARKDLVALAPSIATRLELANGSPLWSPSDIKAYKAAQTAKHKRPLWAPLWNFLLGMSACIAFICTVLVTGVVLRPPQFVANLLLRPAAPFSFANDLWKLIDEKLEAKVLLYWIPRKKWHTNLLNPLTKTYQRDWEEYKVPGFVSKRVEAIRELFHDALFFISFFGSDPILVVEIWEEGKARTFFPIVWDEVDGESIIVPPPT